MNIKARILSRKVVLCYLYQYLYVNNLWKSEIVISDILKAEKLVNWRELTSEEVEEFKQEINTYYQWSSKEEIDYILSSFFVNWDKPLEIDMEYINKITEDFRDYIAPLLNDIDERVKTFKFDEMDIIDKSIFLLWYLEYKKWLADKRLILNEMVELAKRYWDEWSYKLINWILHSIFI